MTGQVRECENTMARIRRWPARVGSLFCTLLLGFFSACGGSTTPTAPTTPPPAASVTLDTWSLVNCVQVAGIFGCDIRATLRNQGPDCAASVRGLLRISTAAGQSIRDVPLVIATSLVLRPNEVTLINNRDTFPQTTGLSARLDATVTPQHC